MGTDKKRREPVDVPPVQAGGRVYAAPHDGVPLGYAQDGGIVTARDAATGALLWSQRVYAVHHGEDIESDKQEVFVTRLTLTADGQALQVRNERGETYRLGLDGRAVDTVSEAP